MRDLDARLRGLDAGTGVRPTIDPTSHEQQLLDRVLPYTHGLFEECRPLPGGRPVTGVIRPPAPASDGERVVINVPGLPDRVLRAYRGEDVVLRPLRARCAAHMVPSGGSTVVHVVFASPPDVPLPGEEGADTEELRLTSPRRGVQVGRWSFRVVDGRVEEFEVRLAMRHVDVGLVSLYDPPDECVPGLRHAERPGPVDEVPVPTCVVEAFAFHQGRWRTVEASVFRVKAGLSDEIPQAGIFFSGDRPGGR